MLLKFCEIITTIFQAFLFVSITNNIAYKYNKISIGKTYIAMIIIFIEVVMLNNSGISRTTVNLLMITGVVLVLLVFFHKYIIDVFLGFGMCYLIVTMTSYFLIIFYQTIVVSLELNISKDIQFFLFVFIPAWLVYFTSHKCRKYIVKAASAIKSVRHVLVFVFIADFAIIFIDTIRADWTIEGMGLMLKSIIYIIAFVSLILTIIYFAKINDKSKEVEVLNNTLNEKIVELKKIKHDYGSEISGLYGLYQLDEIDRMGALLKGIVHRYQNINDSISISEQATPLVSTILYTATSVGINVMVFDSADYDNITITDNELFKLISNIIRNSIDALNKVENPIIKYKSYNGHSSIVVDISNNGPEIPADIRNNIFKAGFSTKKINDGERGYGLSIVRDIIYNCNGRISIESDKEWTRFQMEIPIKAVE